MGWPKTDDELDREEERLTDKQRESLLLQGLLLCNSPGCMNYIDPNYQDQVISGYCESCLDCLSSREK